VEARLGEALNEKLGWRISCREVEWPGGAPEVKALKWQGSGDIAALANANCFLVVPATGTRLRWGESIGAAAEGVV